MTPTGIAPTAARATLPAPGGADRAAPRTCFRRPDAPDLQPDGPLP
jgi:hypothetical protein